MCVLADPRETDLEHVEHVGVELLGNVRASTVLASS